MLFQLNSSSDTVSFGYTNLTFFEQIFRSVSSYLLTQRICEGKPYWNLCMKIILQIILKCHFALLSQCSKHFINTAKHEESTNYSVSTENHLPQSCTHLDLLQCKSQLAIFLKQIQ